MGLLSFFFFFFFVNSLAIDFHTWANKNGKHYTGAEMLRRKAIFNKNAKVVREHNAKNLGFTLSLNGPFADMTVEEYQSRLMKNYVVKGDAPVQTFENVAAPASVDWRSKTPAVRDQAQCGSCYSFGSIGAMEGRLIIAGLFTTSIDLSEQQIVDCSTRYGNLGCNGGRADSTYKYIKAIGGVEKESDYPYKGTKGDCAATESKFVATITGYSTTTKQSESALMNAVAEGHVAVAIDASHISFQLYNGGIYDESKCSSTKLDHEVICVGYGSENGVDYWIIRNSWGTSWGESGYVRMVRNKNNQCGVATDTTIPTGLKKL